MPTRQGGISEDCQARQRFMIITPDREIVQMTFRAHEAHEAQASESLVLAMQTVTGKGMRRSPLRDYERVQPVKK